MFEWFSGPEQLLRLAASEVPPSPVLKETTQTLILVYLTEQVVGFARNWKTAAIRQGLGLDPPGAVGGSGLQAGLERIARFRSCKQCRDGQICGRISWMAGWYETACSSLDQYTLPDKVPARAAR